jgi:hypothetical protein
MAAFTSIGPIGVRQMNSNLYVGRSDLTTIQAAVTAAAQMGGVSTVYIPPEYAGTDSPTAVTGGNSSIYLMDERNGQRQSYLWYNSAYVKEPIIAAGVATPQLNHYIYVGIEGQWPTIQGAVNNAVAGGIGDFVIITTSYGGSETIGSITGGAANVFIVDERTAQRQVYEWNGTNYIPSDFEPLGAIRADLITANDLSVTDASFDTATVADSPVRTFANTPDGPGQGMVWPTPGIPVSQGSTWQNPSINPASLATWPAAGIPTSTGSAWSTSINPADLAHLSLPNTFAATQTVQGDVKASALCVSGAIDVLTGVNGVIDFLTNHARLIGVGVDNTAAGGLRLVGLKPDGSAYSEYMTLDSTGIYLTPPAGTAFSINAPVGVNITGPLTASGNLVANSSTGYLNNATTPSPMRIITGLFTLVNGTTTITFTKPFSAGTAYIVAFPINSAPVGAATTPALWIFSATNVGFTINASSATSTVSGFWVAYGNP